MYNKKIPFVTRFIFLFVAILIMNLATSANAKVNIFACEPEWESLSKEIGGNYVDVFSATTAKQDPHHIRAKPSLVSKIRKADLLFCSGSNLEIGWLPILLSRGSNNIQPNKLGHLMASDFVPKIEKLKNVDRSMGDIHFQGNPHIHLNPYNILLVAKELNNRLKKIDPNNFLYYQKRYEAFVKRWKKSIKKWEAKAIALNGLKILPYHKSFSYLIDWLKLKEVSTIESKPGIPPTPKHLGNLITTLKKNPAQFIILTPFDPRIASNWIAKKTNTKQVILPYTVGGNNNASNLFYLFEDTIDQMLKLYIK